MVCLLVRSFYKYKLLALKSAGAEVCDNRAIKEGSQSSEDQSSHGNDDSDTKRVLMKFQWV
jgi:hypothetical protein